MFLPKYRAIRLPLYLFCTLLSVQTFCSSPKHQITVLTEQWFPFNYRNNDNKIVGSATTAVKDIMSLAGLTYEIYESNWKDVYLMAQKDPTSIIYTTFQTPEREPLFHWLCPIIEPIKISVYALQGSDIKITKGSDIKNYIVGVPQDSYPHEALKSLGSMEGKNLQPTLANQYNIDRLIKKRVDLIVETEDALNTILDIRNLPSNTVKKVYTIDEKNHYPACVAINKNMNANTVKLLKRAHQTWLKGK